jgi:hypothetical protein
VSAPDRSPQSDLREKAEFISALAGADDKTADALTRLMAQMRAGTAGKADYQMAQDAFNDATGRTRPGRLARAWWTVYGVTVIPVYDVAAEVLRKIWWHGFRKWHGGTVLTVRNLGDGMVCFDRITWREWRNLRRKESGR